MSSRRAKKANRLLLARFVFVDWTRWAMRSDRLSCFMSISPLFNRISHWFHVNHKDFQWISCRHNHFKRISLIFNWFKAFSDNFIKIQKNFRSVANQLHKNLGQDMWSRPTGKPMFLLHFPPHSRFALKGHPALRGRAATAADSRSTPREIFLLIG